MGFEFQRSKRYSFWISFSVRSRMAILSASFGSWSMRPLVEVQLGQLCRLARIVTACSQTRHHILCWEALHEQLGKVVESCLASDPADRWQSAKDLKTVLDWCQSQTTTSVTVPARSSRRLGVLLAGGALLLAVLLAAGWLLLKYAGRQSPSPRLVQLTSYPGSELYPSFSPDGNQVAFTGDSENGDNQDIYVKLVGETNAVRLTTDPAPDLWPAWSPDGKRIAFQRNRPEGPGIWLVSPLGGGEQKVADLQVMGQMSWSPDGKWLAVARGIDSGSVGDTRGIFLVPVDGGEPRRISNPRAPAFDIHPSFSPDGRSLGYASCASEWSCDVLVQPHTISTTLL